MSDVDTATEATTVPAPAVTDPLDYDRLAVAIVDEMARRGYIGPQPTIDDLVEMNLQVMGRMVGAVQREAVTRALRSVPADEPGEAGDTT